METLKLGSKGNDVKKLQEFLKLIADGDFGKKTEAALINWQRENGLTPNGVITMDQIPSTAPKYAGNLSLDKLKGHLSDNIIKQIAEAASKFGITTNLRLAHFLSQCSHESAGFTAVNENMNYSSKGLKSIFGKYFPGNMSDLYARNPQKIGSRVYANRMGNGDEATGEGWKYHGRGYIQLTGKDNYSKFSKFIGEDCVTNPDLVSTKYPLASAAYFFNANGIWAICDKGADVSAVTSVTKRVNGGTIGLDDRIKHFNEYYKLLTAA